MTNESGTLNVWRPLNFDPVAAALPIVTFYVTLSIYDSRAVTNRDCFRWSIYNTNNGGERLFSIDFDNTTTEVNFELDDEQFVGWVRRAHETSEWTTSVCTGSLVLAAAGILDGLEATTHWLEYDLLESLGARPTSRRVVEQGKVITAAGVSSGIDMALVLAAHVAGDDVAKAIQLGIEYDPEPPFDSGSPTKAGAEIVELVTKLARAEQAELEGAA